MASERIEHADGTVYWVNGPVIHREDGPAIEYADGSKAWFLDSVEYDPLTWMLKVYELGLK